MKLFKKSTTQSETGVIWLKLVTLFDKLNYMVKDAGWSKEDEKDFYEKKDEFLKQIATQTPKELKVSYFKIPYYKYSDATKDKAGALMRKDTNPQPFEYYLSQIERSTEDIELPEKATVELEIECGGQTFSFHIQQQKTLEWGLNLNKMKEKVWISNKEFQKNYYKKMKEEIERLEKELKLK